MTRTAGALDSASVTRALEQIDRVRRGAIVPTPDGTRWRDVAEDERSCGIVFCQIADADLDRIVAEETALARTRGWTLTWGRYGHDTPKQLPQALTAAGFDAEPEERVLLLRAREESLAGFQPPARCEIRRLEDPEELAGVAEISREIGRTNVEEECRRLARSLEDEPSMQSVHVAYVDGVPLACGRLWFGDATGALAWLCGGRTKTTHRRRGLYTALVHARVREAIARGCETVIVDALPTSLAILLGIGFAEVGTKQDFRLRG